MTLAAVQVYMALLEDPAREVLLRIYADHLKRSKFT